MAPEVMGLNSRGNNDPVNTIVVCLTLSHEEVLVFRHLLCAYNSYLKTDLYNV